MTEASSAILVAPSGPLSLTGVTVMTHQVAIVFPFRAARSERRTQP
jgi:hypothetical protein